MCHTCVLMFSLFYWFRWTTRGDCSDEVVKRDTEAAVGIIIALVEENKA
jgi:hypothetical protein